MNPVEILRRVTRPMTDAEVERQFEERFRSSYPRENVGLDDLLYMQELKRLESRPGPARVQEDGAGEG